MKRLDLPEFRSLVSLLENDTPAKSLDLTQKKRLHPQNLLKIRRKGGVGSGYLLTNDGYFITNNHVLPEEVAQVYINKIPFPFNVARTLIRSRLHDLVLAQIPLNIGSSPTSVVLADQYPRESEHVRTYSFSTERALRSHGVIIPYKDGIPLDGLEELLGNEIMSDFNRLFGPFTEHYQDAQSKVSRNTHHSTCTIKPGWSGGPVVSEATGNILGITKGITKSILPTQSLYSAISRQYHSFSSVVVVRTMINHFLNGQGK